MKRLSLLGLFELSMIFQRFGNMAFRAVENVRDEESGTNVDLKGNLGVSNWEVDHNYCRKFTRES